MEVNTISLDNPARWDDFVKQNDSGCLFHSSCWGQALQQAFQYTPIYFVIQNGHNHITSGIPTFLIKSPITGDRLVSLPFSDYCDPLVESQMAFNTLIQHIFKFAKQSNIKTVVFKTRYSATLFESSNTCHIDSYSNHRLSLPCPNRIKTDRSLDEVFQEFHRSQVQKNIKRSLASNLEVIEVKTESQLKIFYDLIILTRKKHGLLPQAYRFFSSLWHTLGRDDSISILIAQKGSKPIAGIMLVRFKDVMYDLYSASNPKYLKDRPNHLLLWMGIQKAYSEGFRYFDFGRTSLDNIGLLDFKRRWGTIETQLHYFDNCNRGNSSIIMNFKSSLPEVMKRTIRYTPTFLLKFGSNIIYKHLGS